MVEDLTKADISLQNVESCIIIIFHGYEVRIEKSVPKSLFSIMRLCRVMLNNDPEGRIFLFTPNIHDEFFFLYTIRFQFKTLILIIAFALMPENVTVRINVLMSL